ncbi:hypothetical protein PR048_015970 [Dryococelus australis]|uniref:DDE Tnp4 domain-containing protein n=1 Tax=Dryococelus australis TaxID=614101 RepID=A0ABQ9HIF8_9NEOP|nr:hypothetical protein PR048_015970 [Dryococelus australis]
MDPSLIRGFAFVSEKMLAMSLSHTSFGKKLEEGSLNLSPPERMSVNTTPLSHVLIAGEAFGMSTYLVLPYNGKNRTVSSRVYNVHHCRTRRCVESAFGILSSKWRILLKTMACDVQVVTSIVKVCCVLHNFVRDRNGVRFEDTLEITGLYDSDIIVPVIREKPAAYLYRDNFADYFQNPMGSVPWQTNFISKIFKETAFMSI